MNCESCATPISDDSQFCIQCGTAVQSAPGDTDDVVLDAAIAQDMERWLRQETEGEFEIHEELGRGGMAVVFSATEIHLNRKVAIKVLPPEMMFGKDSVERFKREAQTAAALSHPNIVPIYRVSSRGRLFWYAMQFLEGKDLDDLLKEKGRLSLDETTDILMPVAEALDYGHEQGVIHRDVKPPNVMLDARRRVFLTDFGIAKQVAAGTLTASGAAIGTPYYMSPEQCRGLSLTGAADQYSVAVMAYQMLSGTLPFDADSAIDILTQHCMTPPPPLHERCPGLAEHTYRAFDRALAKKPEERFTSVASFVEAIKLPWDEDMAATVAGPQAVAEVETTEVSALKLKRLAPLVAAVVMVVGLGSGVTYWQTRGDQSGSNAATSRIPASQQAQLLSGNQPDGGRPGRGETQQQDGIALISVGSRPMSVITINGQVTRGNPVARYQVPAGEVHLWFEVTDATGTWTHDTIVTVAADELRNLGRIQLTRPR